MYELHPRELVTKTRNGRKDKKHSLKSIPKHACEMWKHQTLLLITRPFKLTVFTISALNSLRLGLSTKNQTGKRAKGLFLKSFVLEKWYCLFLKTTFSAKEITLLWSSE